jgi:hypothetical protein
MVDGAQLQCDPDARPTGLDDPGVHLGATNPIRRSVGQTPHRRCRRPRVQAPSRHQTTGERSDLHPFVPSQRRRSTREHGTTITNGRAFALTGDGFRSFVTALSADAGRFTGAFAIRGRERSCGWSQRSSSFDGKMRSMFGRLTVIGACVLVVAFGSGCASVSVRVDHPSFRDGERGYVAIRNTGWRAAYGNFCLGYGLERRCGTAWIPVEPDDCKCTKKLDAYPAGAVRNDVFHVPRGTPNGTYRLVTRVDGQHGSNDRVTSNEFAVVGSQSATDGCRIATPPGAGAERGVARAALRPASRPGPVSHETYKGHTIVADERPDPPKLEIDGQPIRVRREAPAGDGRPRFSTRS